MTTSTPPQPGVYLPNLADELQQLIYRHVFPITDITLVPFTHPQHIPPHSLTQEFSILGNHPVSLLLTCSKICAIAKPVRDSSFTGAVRAFRTEDVARSGHWIHHNVRAIQLLCPKPGNVATALKLRPELFSNLKRVVVTNMLLWSNLSDLVRDVDGRSSLLVTNSYDDTFVSDARSMYMSLFNNLPTQKRSKWSSSMRFEDANTPQLDVIVRQRYTFAEVSTPASQPVLGVVVKLKGYKTWVLTKIYRDETERNETRLGIWDADLGDDNDDDNNNNHNDDARLNTNSTTVTDVTVQGAVVSEPPTNRFSRRQSNTVRTILNDIPPQYAWVRLTAESFEIDDLA